jgi:ribosomal protein S18 acetylase RimI-like enzyme
MMGGVLQSMLSGEGTAVWLQVWENAAQAIGFYRKWGFREAGQVPFLLGAELQRDLLMSRMLTSG